MCNIIAHFTYKIPLTVVDLIDVIYSVITLSIEENQRNQLQTINMPDMRV